MPQTLITPEVQSIIGQETSPEKINSQLVLRWPTMLPMQLKIPIPYT